MKTKLLKPRTTNKSNIYELHDYYAVLWVENPKAGIELRIKVDRDLVPILQNWYWSPKYTKRTAVSKKTGELQHYQSIAITTSFSNAGMTSATYSLPKVIAAEARGITELYRTEFINGDKTDFRLKNLIFHEKSAKKKASAGKYGCKTVAKRGVLRRKSTENSTK